MKKHLIALAAVACAGAFMSAAGDAGSDTGGTGSGAPPAPPAPAQVKLTKVRVLLDCQHGKCNDVVSLPADVAKEAAAGGLVDPDKAAVKYAESLEQNQPKPEAG